MVAPAQSPATPPSSVRERLLRLVHATPGLNKSQACSRLGVAWGTVSHHVARLQRDGLLAIEARGRDVMLFPAGTAPGLRRSALALREATAARLLLLLEERRQASLRELAGGLDLSRKVVRRLVRGLQAAGLVENHAPGRPRYTRAPSPLALPRPALVLVSSGRDALVSAARAEVAAPTLEPFVMA